MKKGRGLRNLPHKSNGGLEVSKMKLSNLLLDFKQDIINDVATQLNTVEERRKKDEVDAMLPEYCPPYREKKMNYRCNFFATLETQSMPTKFKVIDENGEVVYITQ